MVHSVNKICSFQVVCLLLKLRKDSMMCSTSSVGMLTHVLYWVLKSPYSSLMLRFVMEFANVMELDVRNSLGRFKNSLHITLYNIYLPVYYQ